MPVPSAIRAVTRARRDARRILATHETSTARTLTIEDAYDKLGALSVHQADLLKQSLRAIEHGLYRASIVLSWAAFMDFIEEKLSADGFRVLNEVYDKWDIHDVDDLRDKRPDFQIVGALRPTHLATKGETASIQGMLSVRNEAAHPSEFLPDLNRSLGYVADVIARMEQLKGRAPRSK